jgi:D-cysteine desulfhydrase family pyridoxal phosphate-dependent enzyme
MTTRKLARLPIAHLPTPVEPLRRLSEQLDGPELWVKRDDQTGLATGGNKTRKLEFLVADALAQEADTLITCGAFQSNHARQTAAAAAKFGLASVLVLRGEVPSLIQGNLLLDQLLGAEVVWTANRPMEEVLNETAERLRAKGRRPAIIPYGGSNPVGASGYAAAMEELLAQCTEYGLLFDWIVFASSSGGTQAGLLVGAHAHGYAGQILGISVDPTAPMLQQTVAELATATASHLGVARTFSPDEILVNDSYLGRGYAVIGERERAAIRLLARSEGILLDPVYTGRAFGGLVDLVGRGHFGSQERVLFWHTGGTAGLFGYAEAMG